METQTQTSVIQNKLIEVGIAFGTIESEKIAAEQRAEALQEEVSHLKEELAAYAEELNHLKGVELANHTLELNNSRLQYQASDLKRQIEALESKLSAAANPAVLESMKKALESEQMQVAALELELDRVKAISMEATETLESQTPELIKARELLEKQHTVIIKQKGELDKLLDKHNTEVRKANAAIRNLESLLDQQKQANKALKKKAEKSKLTRPVLGSPLTAVGAELWREGRESLSLAGSMTLMGKDGPIVTDQVMWWEHDSGIKLVCAYSHENNQVMICDPRDAEGNLLLPCEKAVEFIISTFSKLQAA